MQISVSIVTVVAYPQIGEILRLCDLFLGWSNITQIKPNMAAGRHLEKWI